ncbi:unnamed protein product [Trichogramma brassicae]|uniref:Uncharacterized protein n=1 Tax=Trichogramma brassicae TaxID=86971 RepID=A0A6H5ID75_9HYME|nr:unnamed protein product [Trichogramma brassicae]
MRAMPTFPALPVYVTCIIYIPVYCTCGLRVLLSKCRLYRYRKRVNFTHASVVGSGRTATYGCLQAAPNLLEYFFSKSLVQTMNFNKIANFQLLARVHRRARRAARCPMCRGSPLLRMCTELLRKSSRSLSVHCPRCQVTETLLPIQALQIKAMKSGTRTSASLKKHQWIRLCTRLLRRTSCTRVQLLGLALLFIFIRAYVRTSTRALNTLSEHSPATLRAAPLSARSTSPPTPLAIRPTHPSVHYDATLPRVFALVVLKKADRYSFLDEQIKHPASLVKNSDSTSNSRSSSSHDRVTNTYTYIYI